MGMGRAVNVNSTVDQPRYGMEQPRVGMAWFWQSEISGERRAARVGLLSCVPEAAD